MGHSKFIALVPTTLTLGVVLLGLTTCQGHPDPTNSTTPTNVDAVRYPVKFRPRAGGTGSGIITSLRDHSGEVIKAPCGSCHAGKAPKRSRRSGGTLQIFHSGLTLRHGTLTCLTCHNDDDYDTLRLADDTPVQFDDLMTLCGQCHGPQKRDYDHGSHGGMTGFWDLTRGPRLRNQCVHCHDPHAPAYVGVVPAPGPRDRFLRQAVPGKGH